MINILPPYFLQKYTKININPRGLNKIIRCPKKRQPIIRKKVIITSRNTGYIRPKREIIFIPRTTLIKNKQVTKQETNVNIGPQNILINWIKYKSFNYVKEQEEFLEKLMTNNTFIFKDFDSTNDIKQFIYKNINNKLNLIFPSTNRIFNTLNIEKCTEEMISCLQYIKSLGNNIKLKVYFQTGDPFYCKNNFNFYKQLFPSQSKIIHIIIGTLDLDDYPNNVTYKTQFSQSVRGLMHPITFLDRIKTYALNYAYKDSFIPFNDDPINKVALSGTICSFSYPSRYYIHSILQKYPEIYKRIEADRNERNPVINGEVNQSFNLKLNEYIANIYTGVYKFKSLALLKLFEILASGSLLLVVESQILICNKMQLQENVHFKILPENEKDMINVIKYILDEKNREEINNIRVNGQHFCQNKFSVDLSYNSFINIFKYNMNELDEILTLDNPKIEINGRICHHRIDILYALCQKFNLEKYLEIGVHNGSSMSYVLQCSKIKNCIGIDPFELLKTNNKKMKHYQDKDLITKIKSMSNIQKNNKFNVDIKLIGKLSSNVKHCEVGNDIDLLFIDGDHTYDAVLSDFNKFKKVVKMGGFIVLDDLHQDGPKKVFEYILKHDKEVKLFGIYKKTEGIFIKLTPSNDVPID